MSLSNIIKDSAVNGKTDEQICAEIQLFIKKNNNVNIRDGLSPKETVGTSQNDSFFSLFNWHFPRKKETLLQKSTSNPCLQEDHHPASALPNSTLEPGFHEIYDPTHVFDEVATNESSNIKDCFSCISIHKSADNENVNGLIFSVQSGENLHALDSKGNSALAWLLFSEQCFRNKEGLFHFEQKIQSDVKFRSKLLDLVMNNTPLGTNYPGPLEDHIGIASMLNDFVAQSRKGTLDHHFEACFSLHTMLLLCPPDKKRTRTLGRIQQCVAPNITGVHNKTLAHIAALTLNIRALEMLRANGANFYIEDKHGSSPLSEVFFEISRRNREHFGLTANDKLFFAAFFEDPGIPPTAISIIAFFESQGINIYNSNYMNKPIANQLTKPPHG